MRATLLLVWALAVISSQVAAFLPQLSSPLLLRHTSRARLYALEPSAEDIAKDVELCTFDRTGCVLLAQPGEHDHFLMKAAVLVYEHNERGTQGVILTRASAFSLGESAPGMAPVFAPNTLFLGGESGPDMAIMFHKFPLGGYARYIGAGLYVGGLKQAREMVEARQAVPNDFKFIFNNVEWGPGVLDKEIASRRWDVVRLPPDMALQQKQASSIWSRARNVLRSSAGKQLHELEDYGDDDDE